MTRIEVSKVGPVRLAGVMILLSLGCFSANADDKKPAPPKPAAKPTAPAHPAASGAHPAGASAGHPAGPTTSGSHGITTSNAGHATTESHGTTTSNAGHTATATTAGHPGTAGSVRPASAPGHPGANTGAAGGGTGRAAGPSSAHVKTQAEGGTRAESRPTPANVKTVHTASGADVKMRPNGKPADVHVAAKGMDIHHGLNGSRRVEVERADHTRIVAERGGRGYVQHPYMYHGREFGHRTYYYGGRYSDRYYARYPYRGAYLDVYAPAYYYRPGFYGWAYNPWAVPVAYSWGWGGNPWYGYYGYYFNPYPVYPSAAFWLTDYLVSQSLAASYQAQADAVAAAQANAGAPPDAAALTPDVKNLISAEVSRQVALENAESQAAQTAPPDAGSSGLQRMMTDNVQHVFVAGKSLDVVDANGAECAVSEGDALQLTGPPAADATAATLSVLSSKGGTDCHKGVVVSVAFNDLQDMQNHMRETIDQGMGELQSKAGKGGLPTVPPSAAGQPTPAAFTAGAPGPDQTAGTEIAQQSQQADQAEKEALAGVQGAASGPGPSLADAAPAGPPPTLSIGQSVDDTIAIEGQPTKVVDLKTKKTYYFKDGIKVTFKDGKSTDIQ
jgi:hypothetical protein